METRDKAGPYPLRPLLPANASKSSSTEQSASTAPLNNINNNNNTNPTNSTSTTQPHKYRNTSIACHVCRGRKTRCDGLRPVCSPCRKRNVQCQWPGLDTVKIAKEKLSEIEDQLHDYKTLHENMQTRSESEAAEIFRRIRSGQDIASILAHLRDGDLLLQMSVDPKPQ